MLALRLSKETENRLDFLAKETGRTKAFYARQAIEEKLEELEDIYLAESVVERLRSGSETIHTASETKTILGL